MDKKDAIAEYDRYYRKKPEKWTSLERNEYARAAIEDYLEDQPKSVLDVGCGNGHTLKYLGEKWPHAKLFGFDLSPVAIETAKAKLPDADLRAGFLDEMSYGRTFDCVILLGVIEHLEDIPASLQQLKALISQNGIIYIEAPNPLAYEGSTPEEGYRRVNFGNRQMEWHLKRQTWVDHFVNAGFDIAVSKIGPTPQTEYIFILEHADVKLSPTFNKAMRED